MKEGRREQDRAGEMERVGESGREQERVEESREKEGIQVGLHWNLKRFNLAMETVMRLSYSHC